MSKERDLLNRAAVTLEVRGICPLLLTEISELLAQPEQEDIYQKLLRIEDGIEVEILPSELWLEGYEVGKRIMQPKQEPEAWILEDKKTGFRRQSAYKPTDLDEETCNVIPLYTAPPKREPLSDEEIMILGVQNLCNEADSFKPFGFARAIEKAHGIGVGKHD